jgi:hypothetical protein
MKMCQRGTKSSKKIWSENEVSICQGSNKRPCTGILAQNPKSQLYAQRLFNAENASSEFQHASEFAYFFEKNPISVHEV